MICSNCAQNWWAIRPAFGSYTGNYAYLASATNSAAPWDTRLSYTFEGVTPGSSYYVGFWQKYRDAGAIASWTVTLGGTVVHNTLPQFPPYPEYINSASVVATSTSLTLVFDSYRNMFRFVLFLVAAASASAFAPARSSSRSMSMAMEGMSK